MSKILVIIEKPKTR